MRDDHENPATTLKLDHFLPYRLSVASNAVSTRIAKTYRKRYNLKVTEWRLIATSAALVGLATMALNFATLACSELAGRSIGLSAARRTTVVLEAGIRIYEYLPSMMHAKTMVADGMWATVGSMNADNRSLSFNEESNLLVLDHALAARLERLFMEDLEHSREIELATFRRRPVRQKALELAAHAVWRVL